MSSEKQKPLDVENPQKTKANRFELLATLHLLKLSGRFFTGLLLFALVIFLSIYWLKWRWFLWTNNSPWYLYLSALNGIVFLWALVGIGIADSLFTLPLFLRFSLLAFQKKQDETKRNFQSISLLLFLLSHFAKQSSGFTSAFFAVIVLSLGTLNLELQSNPLYWLNLFPCIFAVTFRAPRDPESFTLWVARYLYPQRSLFFPLSSKEELHEENATSS